MFGRRFVSFVVGACGILAPIGQARALNNQLALTPPMGFNSWNAFHCDINETTMRHMTDLMVQMGLRDAGYRYVTLDDCWAVGRDNAGHLQADPNTFPSGIAALADYVHSRGMLFGLYTSAGPQTCQGRPGSYNYENLDMATFAGWGVDMVKIDWCHADALTAHVQYPLFTQAVAATQRAILISISNYGADNVASSWGPTVANMWRTNGDLQDTFATGFGILPSLYSNARFQTAAGPDGWNDLDMLQVGNGGMTDTEDQAHFALWVVESSPLFIGTDLTSISPTALSVLTNAEVIAISQDSNGTQGFPTQVVSGDHSVWTRPLSSGGYASVALNENTVAQNITIDFATLGLPANQPLPVRDVLNHRALGSFTGVFTATAVPGHGVAMVVIGNPLPLPTSTGGSGTGGSGTGGSAGSTGSGSGGTTVPVTSTSTAGVPQPMQQTSAGCAQSPGALWPIVLTLIVLQQWRAPVAALSRARRRRAARPR